MEPELELSQPFHWSSAAESSFSAALSCRRSAAMSALVDTVLWDELRVLPTAHLELRSVHTIHVEDQ